MTVAQLIKSRQDYLEKRHEMERKRKLQTFLGYGIILCVAIGVIVFRPDILHSLMNML